MMESEIGAFFDGRPEERAVYDALEEALRDRYPEMTFRVQKSCVAFDDPRPFCYASLQRCGGRRGPYLLVTFGLEAPIADPRVAVVTQPYPNRWTHHVPVAAPGEVDDQLLAWIDWAHSFSKRKRRAQRQDTQTEE